MSNMKQRSKLGQFLDTRAVNQAAIVRMTGIGKNRISELAKNEDARIKADELYLIAKAIDADPCKLLNLICSDLQLTKP